MKLHSRVRLFATPWTAAHQAPPSMGSSRQEYWSGVPLPSPTRPFRTNTQKRCLFHYRGLEYKSRKSRNTWSNRQIWPWSTEWSRAKANRVLQRERTGHSKHPLPTTQEKTLHMDIIRWPTPKLDLLYSLQPKMEKLYTVSKNKTGSWQCSDHELLIAKFRLKLKKVGKTTRPFRYDLKSNPLWLYSGSEIDLRD